MCKEMQIIPVNRVVDPKRTIEKMEGQGEGEAQGVADPPPPQKKPTLVTLQTFFYPTLCCYQHWPKWGGLDQISVSNLRSKNRSIF
jgi:hypothetical protein